MITKPVSPGSAKNAPIVVDAPGKRNGRQGFTLGELILVIGTVVVLLAILIAGVNPLSTAKLAQTMQDIQTIILAGTAYRAQQPAPTHEGISFTALKNLALLPPAASENNPWGNAYGVSGTARILTVTTDTVHANRCETLQRILARRAVWSTLHLKYVDSTFLAPRISHSQSKNKTPVSNSYPADNGKE